MSDDREMALLTEVAVLRRRSAALDAVLALPVVRLPGPRRPTLASSVYNAGAEAQQAAVRAAAVEVLAAEWEPQPPDTGPDQPEGEQA